MQDTANNVKTVLMFTDYSYTEHMSVFVPKLIFLRGVPLQYIIKICNMLVKLLKRNSTLTVMTSK